MSRNTESKCATEEQCFQNKNKWYRNEAFIYTTQFQYEIALQMFKNGSKISANIIVRYIKQATARLAFTRLILEAYA